MKRILTLLALTSTLTACDAVLGSEPERSSAAIFDEVWSEFDRHYSFFGIKGVDWNASRETYRSRATAAVTDAQLADAIWAMLEPLRDVHVTLTIPFRTFSDTSHFARPDYFHPEEVVFADFVRFSRTNAGGRFRYGTIGTDIGYIWIPQFGDFGWAHQIDLVLDELGPVAYVIIDVRSNGGGASSNSDEIAGRFMDRERVYSHVRFRNGPRHHDFTADIPQRIAPRGKHRFAGRVAVLTNRHTFSAAETFVLSMRASPRVIVVGDTTGGGSGNPLPRELPNGWHYQIPQWIQFDLQGRTIEDRGIAPDITVQGTRFDRERVQDPALSAAITALRTGVE